LLIFSPSLLVSGLKPEFRGKVSRVDPVLVFYVPAGWIWTDQENLDHCKFTCNIRADGNPNLKPVKNKRVGCLERMKKHFMQEQSKVIDGMAHNFNPPASFYCTLCASLKLQKKLQKPEAKDIHCEKKIVSKKF